MVMIDHTSPLIENISSNNMMRNLVNPKFDSALQHKMFYSY